MADLAKLARSARRWFRRRDRERAEFSAWLERQYTERVTRLVRKWRTR